MNCNEDFNLDPVVFHRPVMVREILSVLEVSPGKKLVDGTVGEGGHAVSLARRIKPHGILVGLDKDKGVLDIARSRLAEVGSEFRLFHGSYITLKKILKKTGLKEVDGVLLDLGVSMRQIKKSSRGFSFTEDNVLDMRFNPAEGIPAYRWLKEAEAEEIKQVLEEYGQEEESKRVSEAIVELAATREKITAAKLASVVVGAKRRVGKRTHPATKTFQAIRIHINSELQDLGKGLLEAAGCLKEGGRLAVLTYHSLEDRLVKKFLLKYSGKCTCPPAMPVCGCGAKTRRPKLKILPASGIMSSKKEKKENPASRSAHLRAAEVILK